MDAIKLIVQVLSVGSFAFSHQLGGPAVKDAYRTPRRLAAGRLKSTKPIEALEQAPKSRARKRALAAALFKANASKDFELVASARKLDEALSRAEIVEFGGNGDKAKQRAEVSINIVVDGTIISYATDNVFLDEPSSEHRRTIDVNLFADVFEPGREATLTVTLRLPRSKKSGKWQSIASVDPARGPVTVILETHGFTLLSEAPPPLDLQEDRDSPPIAFEIRIEVAAHRWLHLFLLQAGAQVGELLINDFSTFSQSSGPLLTTAPFRIRGEADLTLLVRANDKRIEACSPRDRACLDYKSLGEFRYPEQSFRKSLAGRLRSLYDDQASPADAEREL